MSQEKKIIRVGSRKSELALIQTNYVISLLKEKNPSFEFEIVTMNTLGDKILDIPLPKIGEKSLFTKELEAALVSGCVNFVVHSLKDLPTTLPPGMAIGAVLSREDPRDALVLQKDVKKCTLKDLSEGSIIGTSSLRRTAQLAKKYPKLKVENIRGNLNTRLKKLDDLGKYQAIILAAAGLVRMGWGHRITKVLDTDEILYAVGQGALAVECREDDEETIKLLSPLYDLHTALRIISERSFMKTLGGGCSAPVGVSSELINTKGNDYKLVLNGAVWSLDGKEEVKESESCSLFLKDFKRCASCPFNNKNLTRSIEDIECLKDCTRYSSPVKENPSKKAKYDNVPSEVLENDPHEHCPIEIPIGADFMGKCPYLETGMATLPNKCPVSGKIEGAPSVDMFQCPFLKKYQTDNNIVQNTECSSSQSTDKTESDKLFCGLVAHKDVTVDTLRGAYSLGVSLAKKLMDQGAIEIMTKAQNFIHSSVGTTTKSS